MLLKHSLRFSQGLCSFAMEASLAETTFDSVMLFAKNVIVKKSPRTLFWL